MIVRCHYNNLNFTVQRQETRRLLGINHFRWNFNLLDWYIIQFLVRAKLYLWRQLNEHLGHCSEKTNRWGEWPAYPPRFLNFFQIWTTIFPTLVFSNLLHSSTREWNRKQYSKKILSGYLQAFSLLEQEKGVSLCLRWLTFVAVFSSARLSLIFNCWSWNYEWLSIFKLCSLIRYLIMRSLTSSFIGSRLDSFLNWIPWKNNLFFNKMS